MGVPVNTAAWIPSKYGRLEVGPAPYSSPGDDQIVVRNHAVAVNPLDWIIQVAGPVAYRWLTYPTILGADVAGEVVEIGRAVTRFAVGDRVLGHAVGSDKDSNRAAEGAFQQYTVVLERMACALPDSMAFLDAAVLPLAVSTAACGLFQRDQLGLRHPSLDATPTGETVLVWGGSTSVGANAIQLAVAAGYDVVSTASAGNAGFVESLGAITVFDHHDPDAVAEISSALQGRDLAGAIAFGETGASSCIGIVARCHGNRFVSIASTPVSFARAGDSPGRGSARSTAVRIGAAIARQQVSARLRQVRTRYIFGTTLKSNEVSSAIYRDFLPDALAAGRYRAVPPPMVLGHGLEAIQHAMDVQRGGVSAAKVVVDLS